MTIPHAAFSPMRMQLANAGVTSAVLYPDLDGVAQYICRTHLRAGDEMLSRLGLSPNLYGKRARRGGSAVGAAFSARQGKLAGMSVGCRKLP